METGLMTLIKPSVWSYLESNIPQEDYLFARPGVPDVSLRLLCALDGHGQRHLLVKLQPNERELEDRHSRGVIVLTRVLSLQEEPPARYIDLICRDSTGF